jgi:hypothetical protein
MGERRQKIEFVRIPSADRDSLAIKSSASQAYNTVKKQATDKMDVGGRTRKALSAA